MTVTLRRHFICRTGGLPTAHVHDWRAPETIALVDELEGVRKRLTEVAGQLTGLLFDAVTHATGQLKWELLRIRRDVFNLRLPAPGHRDAAEQLADSQVEACLDHYIDLLHGEQRLTKAVASSYARDLHRSRICLRRSMQEVDFARGLLVSSPQLYESMQSYLATSVEVPNARLEKTERGVIRYLTRTAMKATPFSTFCAVIAGKFNERTSAGERPARTARTRRVSGTGARDGRRRSVRAAHGGALLQNTTEQRRSQYGPVR